MNTQKKAYEVRNGDTILVEGGVEFYVASRRNTPAFCHFTGKDGRVVKVRTFGPVTVVPTGGAK